MVDYLGRMVRELHNIPNNVVLKSIDIDQLGRYWITSDGRILSVCREEPRYKNFTDNGQGYLYTELNGKKYYLHRLLAFLFNTNKENIKDNYEVHHIDRNRKNNSLDNLCIVSPEKHKAIHSIWNKLDNWSVIEWEK